MNRPSKKHHFVTQAQLRHFAADSEQNFIHVFDKQSGKSWKSSILNAGSENDFNTVTVTGETWNFEYLFGDVDARSAKLVSEIIGRRSVAWLEEEDRLALVELIITQMLRTHFTRTTQLHLAEQMQSMLEKIGYNPDSDPLWALPTDAALRLSAARMVISRTEHAPHLLRLVPALFAAGETQRFILSDDPVVRVNAFPYGDCGLASHGILVVLPISPSLALVLVCPTIISRYEAIEGIEMPLDKKKRMLRYLDGFRSGTPIAIEKTEIEGFNLNQISGSRRFLYSHINDFAFAESFLSTRPDLREVKTHTHMGELGRGPLPKHNMPKGVHLVINGKFDSCMLPIAEIDESGEGITARTSNLKLLKLVSEDLGMMRVELYEDGRARRGMAQVMLERFGDDSDGWFRVVHREKSMRSLMQQIDQERGAAPP